MGSIKQFDIMIVGAGPAGTSTWLHLQKSVPALADRTVLIEATSLPRDKLCAGGLGAWSADVLHSLDVDIDIPFLQVPDVEFRYRQQRWVYRAFRPFRMVQRADFDFKLVQTAISRGMILHENEQFIAAENGLNELAVKTNRGRYNVKALVGADGSLSKVRRLMGKAPEPCLATTLQYTAPVDSRYDSEFDQKKMSLDLLPVDEGVQGYIWHCPCLRDGAPYMNHGIVNFRVHPGASRTGMKTILRRELQARNIDMRLQTWDSHPIRCFSDQGAIARPHVILAGDAAGIEPAFGGGIHMALSYGDIAAKALKQAFESHDFSFRNYPRTLQTNFLGRHIMDYTRLAEEMYGGKKNPLRLVRRFFTERAARGDLLSLLMNSSGNR